MSEATELGYMPPHAAAIGMTLVGTEGRVVRFRVPYAEHLIGDPDTGVIHGGVITATLDNASGWAIRAHEDWAGDRGMATLDIRIDYMRMAEPGKDLMLAAECVRLSPNIAFVEARAYQDDPDDPVATSIASFMLGTAGGPMQ